MSKGSLLCSLVLLHVCIAQLSLISSSQLTERQVGDNLWCQDPIWRARLMSSHGRSEFGGHGADSIFEEELADEPVDTGSECNDGGIPVPGGEACGDVECPECGKFFKNDKSMFGHLRSHPNRGYKGATPPVKKLELSSETAVSSSSFSSSGTYRPMVEHRGRDPHLTPLEILCAYGILTLKYRDNVNRQEEEQVPPLQRPSFGDIEAIGQAEGGIQERGTGDATTVLKCNNVGSEAGNCDEHGGFIVKIPKKKRNRPKEVREAHWKKAKRLSTPKEKRLYICKHCKAEFSTHQALGGHMAAHHREKKVLALNGSLLRAHHGIAAESQNGKQQVRDSGEDNNWRSNYGLSPAVVSTLTPTDDGDGCRLLNIDLNVEVLEQEQKKRKRFACSENRSRSKDMHAVCEQPLCRLKNCL